MKITVCIWLVTFVDNIWSGNASANKSFLIVNRDTSSIKQMLSKYTVEGWIFSYFCLLPKAR